MLLRSQFPKDFPRIASFLPNKSAGECVAFYYDTKHVAGYKHRLKAVNASQRRRGPRNQWLHACGAARDIGVPLHLDVVRGYSAAGRIISAVGRSSDVAFSRLLIHPGPYARVHALHRFATFLLPLNLPSRGAGTAGCGAVSGGGDGFEAAISNGADPFGRRNEFMLCYGTGVASLPWGSRFGVVAAAADRICADAGAIDTLALLPSATAAAAGAGAGVGASLVRVFMGADALTRAENGRGGASNSSPKAGVGLTGALSLRHAAWTGIFTNDRPTELVPPSATPLAWTLLGGVGSGPGASTAAFFPMSPAVSAAIAASVLLAAIVSVTPASLLGAGLEPAGDDSSSDSDESDEESDEDSGARRGSRGAEQAVSLRRLAAILVGGPPPQLVGGSSAGAAARARGALATRGGARAPARRGGGAASRGGGAVLSAGASTPLGPPHWSRGLVKAWLSLLAKCLPLALLPASATSDPRTTGFQWRLLAGALSTGCSFTPAVGTSRLPAALRNFFAEAAGAVAVVVSSMPVSCSAPLTASVQLANAVFPILAVGASGCAVSQGHSALRDLAVSLLESAAEACLVRGAAVVPASSPRPFSASAPQSPLPAKSGSNGGSAAMPQTPSAERPDSTSLVVAASAALADRSADVVTTYAATIAIREAPVVGSYTAVPARCASAVTAAASTKIASATVNAELLASSVGPFAAPLMLAAALPPSVPSALSSVSATPRGGSGLSSSSAAGPAWLPPSTVTLRFFDPLRAMHAAVGPGDVAGVPSAQVSAAFPRRLVESFVLPPAATEDFVRRRLPALARAFTVRGSDTEDDDACAVGVARGKKASRLGAAAVAPTMLPAPAPAPRLSVLLSTLLCLPPDGVPPRHYAPDPEAARRRDRGFVDPEALEALPDLAGGLQGAAGAVVSHRGGPSGGKKRAAAAAAHAAPAVKNHPSTDAGAAAAALPAPETGTDCDPTGSTAVASASSGVQAVARWVPEEREAFISGLKVHGRNWHLLQTVLPSKTPLQIRNYFQNNRVRLGLDALISQAEGTDGPASDGVRVSPFMSDGAVSESEAASAAPTKQRADRASDVDADATRAPDVSAAAGAVDDRDSDAGASGYEFGVDDFTNGDDNGSDRDSSESALSSPATDGDEGDDSAVLPMDRLEARERLPYHHEECIEEALEPPAASAIDEDTGDYPYEDGEDASEYGGGGEGSELGVEHAASSVGLKRRRPFSSDEDGGEGGSGDGAYGNDRAYGDDAAHGETFYREEGSSAQIDRHRGHSYEDVDETNVASLQLPSRDTGFACSEGVGYGDADEGDEPYFGKPAEEGEPADESAGLSDVAGAGQDSSSVSGVPEALMEAAMLAAAAGRGAGFGLAAYAPGPGADSGDDAPTGGA